MSSPLLFIFVGMNEYDVPCRSCERFIAILDMEVIKWINHQRRVFVDNTFVCRLRNYDNDIIDFG